MNIPLYVPKHTIHMEKKLGNTMNNSSNFLMVKIFCFNFQKLYKWNDVYSFIR